MTPSPESSGPELEMASVLFTDIVGFSRNPLEKQGELLNQLQQVVRETKEYQRAEQHGHLLKLPTGDGMALVFFQDPVAPVRCAVEIQNLLKSHPQLLLRTGIHNGPVFRQADIKDNINVVGGGINIAQRVMDCGDGGHILISRAVADVLEQLNDWPACVKELGVYEVKHGLHLQIFNVIRDGAGNPEPPAKLRVLQEKAAPPPKRLWPVWVGLGVVVLAAGAWFASRPSPAPSSSPAPPVAVATTPAATTPASAQEPERILRYHVMLQRFRNDEKFGEAKRLPGEAAIETGNGIKLVVAAGEPGYLYVLNEAAESTPEKPQFNIFFPSPRVREGSAKLEKDDEVQIPERAGAYLRFDAQQGTEKFWIVWSAGKLPKLEALKMYATVKYKGVVDAVEAKTLPELLGKYPREKESKTDPVNKLTELHSSDKVMVHLIQWQHY